MRRFWREAREYVGALTVAFLVVTFGFTTVGVAGPSMEPTLNGGSEQLPESLFVGDRVFVPKYETCLCRLGVMSGYSRGDVVIVRELADSPARQGRRSFVIKRVIGVPGDTVEGRAGHVWVNGKLLNESFLGTTPLGKASFPALTLGQKE